MLNQMSVDDQNALGNPTNGSPISTAAKEMLEIHGHWNSEVEALLSCPEEEPTEYCWSEAILQMMPEEEKTIFGNPDPGSAVSLHHKNILATNDHWETDIAPLLVCGNTPIGYCWSESVLQLMPDEEKPNLKSHSRLTSVRRSEIYLEASNIWSTVEMFLTCADAPENPSGYCWSESVLALIPEDEKVHLGNPFIGSPISNTTKAMFESAEQWLLIEPHLLCCDELGRRLAETTSSRRAEVVVARFDEALNWTTFYRNQVHFTIYDKSNSPSSDSVRLPNIGRESHTYLHHIVSRYNSLADWTVFTQGGKPSFGYQGHRKGGGHLNNGISFADYLVPQEHSFFVDPAAFSTLKNHSTFVSSLRMSYLYNNPSLFSSICPSSINEWSE